MEITKQDFEDLAAPAIKVIRQDPTFEAAIDRDRLLTLTRGMYPAETEDFTDDEIVTILRFYGKANESSAAMIQRAALHLDDVKGKRARALPGDKPAPNDPIEMAKQDPGKSPIGKPA